MTLLRSTISGALFAAVVFCTAGPGPWRSTAVGANTSNVPTRLVYVIKGFRNIPPEYIDLNALIVTKEIGAALNDPSRVIFREGTCNADEDCISLSDTTSDYEKRTGEKLTTRRYELVVICTKNESFTPKDPIDSASRDPVRRASRVAFLVAGYIKEHDTKVHSE